MNCTDVHYDCNKNCVKNKGNSPINTSVQSNLL